jgi:hypothetical protein
MSSSNGAVILLAPFMVLAAGAAVAGICVAAAGALVGATALGAAYSLLSFAKGIGGAANAFAGGISAAEALLKEQEKELQAAREKVLAAQSKNAESRRSAALLFYGKLDFGALGIKDEMKEKLATLPADVLLVVASSFADFGYLLTQADSLLSRLKEAGIATGEIEGKVTALRNKVAHNINAGDLRAIGDDSQALRSLIEEARELYHASKRSLSQATIEETEALFFIVDNSVGAPWQEVYANELAALIHSPDFQAEKEEETRARIIALEKKILDLAGKLETLSLYDPEAGADELLKKLSDIHFADYGLATKEMMCQDLETSLAIRYEHFRKRNSAFVAAKEAYDPVYHTAAALSRYLGKKVPEYGLTRENAQSAKEALSFEVEELKKEAKEKAERELAEKALREVMRDLECDFLASDEVLTKKGKLHRDYFAYENGSIVIASFTADGHITTAVRRPKMEGESVAEETILTAGAHFCAQKEVLYRELGKKGVNIKEK